MTSVRVNNEVSYMSVYVIFAVLVVGVGPELALGNLGKEVLVIALAATSLALIGIWIKLIQTRRQCEVDVLGNRVTIHSVSPFFLETHRHHQLDQFGSVRSYITPGRFPRNRVELVTKGGGEALLVAWFQPSNGARSFWSIPTEAESPKAALIRRNLASQCGLADEGFQGTKMVGAQIRE